ncbi:MULTISPECIES: hypothetical protein [Halorussus]|uniref:hypothetical protein n=1 Tax=Halorussus TaxID=1070314 RepID=UPI00209F921C|nr:hypothetical protein [Halorussus vallis]USZ76709.1 hypothetical protein NGM07_05125 [Halorussus vallis]
MEAGSQSKPSGSDRRDDSRSMKPDEAGVRGRIADWVLLEGNRFVVAGVIAAGVAVLIYGLALAGVVTLGPSSNVRTLLSSGVISGLLTLVTVSLSINQLLLSRVFGSPDQLSDRLAGTEDFRGRLSTAADRPLSQNDPKAFLLAVVEALRDHGERLANRLDADAPDELADLPEELIAYADSVADAIESGAREGESNTMDVMASILGPEYAYGLTKIPRLQEEYADRLSDEGGAVELEAALELLKGVSIFRQFLKTVAIQQDLARLSRLIAYSGVAALATTFVATLFYKSSSGAVVSPAVLRPAVSLALGIIVVPLALLVSYILRVATVSRYTVSVGSFVPPEEQFER